MSTFARLADRGRNLDVSTFGVIRRSCTGGARRTPQPGATVLVSRAGPSVSCLPVGAGPAPSGAVLEPARLLRGAVL